MEIEPNITHEVRQHLLGMGYDSITNYIVPGLSSHLIGEDARSSQKIRMFCNHRTQDMPITPHSHRFDLACMVLHGSVENTIYAEPQHLGQADEFFVSSLVYDGNPGQYYKLEDGQRSFSRSTRTYTAGQWYFMTHDQIHSITFSKDAMVLIFEGEAKTDRSMILEPYVFGEHIKTFKVEDWMFKA